MKITKEQEKTEMEEKITRKNAVYPLGDNAPLRLKLSLAIVPLLQIMLLISVKTNINNLTNVVLSGMNAASFFGVATVVLSMAQGITQPIGGKLGDIFGRKRLVMVCSLLLAASTVLCALATSMVLYIISYFLIGIFYGLIANAHHAMAADLFSGKLRATIVSTNSAAQSLANMFIPMLIGSVADIYGAQKAILVLSVMVIGVFLVCTIGFPDIRTNKEVVPIDYKGIIMWTLAFGPFVCAFSMAGKQLPWNSLVLWGLVAISVVFVLIFVKHEKTAEYPMISLELFRMKEFVPVTILGAFAIPANTLGTTYLVMCAQNVLGFGAAQTGAFNILSFLPMVASPLVGVWLGTKMNYRRCFTIANTLALVGPLFYLFFLRPGISLISIIIIRGFAHLSMAFDGATPTAYLSEIVAPELRGSAIAVCAFGNTLVGTIAGVVYALMFNNIGGGIEASFRIMIIFPLVLLVIRYFIIAKFIRNPKRREAK